ncbi:MFS transporter [Pectobacterium punjabense]|uniref:MFS transporter n=1 Tax=Pectobacterium punjabense TaxID=2108399 RepID=A0ABX6L564_9GAMM|nr:MFS transporter [Pectobacterium punjabense]MBS4431351.1 MFS transporter [Pectobacterium punjabense]PTA62296.1 MFS transporter [Pectobacterium punjabense]QJA21435.1 MFS transporter [Pectobacterium punjabense]
MNSIFHNSRFTAWAIGLAFDRLGNAMYMVALPLMVYHMTSSLKNMAIVTVCQFLPRIFPGIYVGSMVDISNKKNIFFISLLLQCFIGIIIATLYSMQLLPFILLCILGAITSVCFEISRTTEMTLVPVIFAKERVKATTALASIHTAMFMVGPLLGALLLKYFSYTSLLLLNALTYLAPIVANYWTKIPSLQSVQHRTKGLREKLALTNHSLKESLATVRSSKALKLLMMFITCITLATGGLELLIIFYIKNRLHVSDQFASLMYAIGAVGMFLGSILVPLFRKIKRKIFLFITLLMIAGGISLFQIGSIPALISGQLLIFMGIFACSVTQDLIIQESAPPTMLGRISGILRIINSTMISLSTFFLTSLTAFLSFKYIALIVILLVLLALILSQNPHFSSTHYEHSEHQNE